MNKVILTTWALLTGTLALSTLATEVHAEAAIPSYQNLLTAKSIVLNLSQRVEGLLCKVGLGSGGGDRVPEGPDYQEDRSLRTFGEGEIIGLYREELRDNADVLGETLENDRAAGFALQAIGTGLFKLGNLVDQATFAYGTSAFLFYRNKACNKAYHLIRATFAGKVAALIPEQGYIRPYEFDQIVQELNAVKYQLYCQ